MYLNKERSVWGEWVGLAAPLPTKTKKNLALVNITYILYACTQATYNQSKLRSG